MNRNHGKAVATVPVHVSLTKSKLDLLMFLQRMMGRNIKKLGEDAFRSHERNLKWERKAKDLGGTVHVIIKMDNGAIVSEEPLFAVEEK